MSTFVPENSGSPQQQKQPDQARPKRPRSSLACIRCRKKKVKCDFVQPTCGRCAIAGLPCSYATPPRRVDGHAFDQLGNHVEELKERMQKMQSELAMMKNNLHPFANSATHDDMDSSASSTSMMMKAPTADSMALATSGSDQNVTWKLSLSPSGLRIDTNIASVADLYRILLNGISQLNINNDSTTSLFNPESTKSNNSSSMQQNTDLNSTRQQKSMSTGATGSKRNNHYLDTSMTDTNMNKGGRLWEVDDNEARKILQEKKPTDDTLSKEKLNGLMHSCYYECFLAYEVVDKKSFMQQYMAEEGMDPLLANSINAWVSKHGCIYHPEAGLSPTSASTMGEVYFKNARQLLKKCFDISSPTTIHALLNLYMYQLSSERSSLAYLYIGLAIRMAQDLKFHKKEHMPSDPTQRETNKRLWWSAYWLDLCAALESNRPTMVDDKDCDLEYPVRLDHEDNETEYRIHFTVYSIKLMRIRKDITKHLPSEQSGQSLLSAISRLENALTNWLSELPHDLHYDYDSGIFHKTESFRDEACLILNIQYQTTWIMLHKFFLPKQDQTATPVALLSLNICTKSANMITRMLTIYASNLHWCQFFYAMDGIVASVTIHQVNALSNEKEVSCLAQRNLILTANVLKESPLMYMVKVCDIIESIEGFLKKNELPLDLAHLPAVDEGSVNKQSISSVFHPAVFESQHMMQQQHQAPSQATNFHSSDSVSPSIQHNAMMNSPQSQHSSSTVRIPSQLNSLFQQEQQSSSSPVSVTTNSTTAGQSNSQQQMYNDQNMMVESNMLFNDPTSLMNFNMTTGAGQGGGGDMDQLLLRNMGFDLNNASSSNDATSRMYNMFDSTTSNNVGPSTPPITTTGSSVNTTTIHTHNNNRPSTIIPSSNSNINNHPYSTNPVAAATVYDNGFYNNSIAQQQSSRLAANTQPNPYHPNFLNNNAELFGLSQQQQQPQAYSNAAAQAFDPNSLFGMNMDPATMSALLYNNAGMTNFNQFSPGGAHVGANNGPPGGVHSQQGNQDLLFGAPGPNNGRKRVQRDWEDPT